MTREELNAYVREHTQPTALDIEVAKRVILEQLDATTSPATEPIALGGLLSHDERALFQSSGPAPEYYDRLDPDLNQLKAHIAAREALLSLHATGVLIAFGSVRDQIETHNVAFHTPHRIVSQAGQSDERAGIFADWYGQEATWLDWALAHLGYPPFVTLVQEP